MTFTKQHWAILIATLAYVFIAGAYFLSIGNYEFLWYIAVLLFFVAFIGGTLNRSQIPAWLLWLLSLWGLLHMAGGGVVVGDNVLYRFVLLDIISDGGEFTILKYDQFVHAYGFGVAALVVRHLISRSAAGSLTPFWIGALAVCAAMGLGAVNEIVEFIAVVASPETGVGGYYNTALDLVFNGLGAVFAIVLASIFSKSRVPR